MILCDSQIFVGNKLDSKNIFSAFGREKKQTVFVLVYPEVILSGV